MLGVLNYSSQLCQRINKILLRKLTLTKLSTPLFPAFNLQLENFPSEKREILKEGYLEKSNPRNYPWAGVKDMFKSQNNRLDWFRTLDNVTSL